MKQYIKRLYRITKQQDDKLKLKAEKLETNSNQLIRNLIDTL